MTRTHSCLATSEADNSGSVVRDASIMGNYGVRNMDIHTVIMDILARASMLELRDAMRTADKFGDEVSVHMFRREIDKRVSE